MRLQAGSCVLNHLVNNYGMYNGLERDGIMDRAGACIVRIRGILGESQSVPSGRPNAALGLEDDGEKRR